MIARLSGKLFELNDVMEVTCNQVQEPEHESGFHDHMCTMHRMR